MSKLVILAILIILPLSLQSFSSSNIDLDLIEGTDIFAKGDYITVMNNITLESESFNIEFNDVSKSTYNGLDGLGRMEFNETRYVFDTAIQEHAKTYVDPISAALYIDCQTDTLGDSASMSYDFWPQADQFINGSQIFEGNYYNLTIINSGMFQIGNSSIETWIANGRALNNFADINITMRIMKLNGLTLSFNGYVQTTGSYSCDGTYALGSQRIEINSTTVGLQLSNYGLNITSPYAEHLKFDSTAVSPDPTVSPPTSFTSTDYRTVSTTTMSTTIISTTTMTSSSATTSTPTHSNETLETTSDSLLQDTDDTLELPFNYMFGIYSFVSIIALRRFKN
ncbi:MAG: hypothetical protein GPJ54_02420 [Candidatus Heimdallarchaeota archaeon]|nr:hypothetical protein [Candidatus Heimdallarchaeota archaeon]